MQVRVSHFRITSRRASRLGLQEQVPLFLMPQDKGICACHPDGSLRYESGPINRRSVRPAGEPVMVPVLRKYIRPDEPRKI